ncbi:iron donor protein CyaY [Aquaspirillum serpens]|uniref:iron donor protein CyaY n=1 Tax=Aquaspirillum serpens TaxID=190 RepID=UPI0003B5586B|nr:iron donor protein CyaY [Aquaspirillum serpens]
MTESEFLDRAEQIFQHIQNVLDQAESDIEVTNKGAVLELEFNDGSQIILNRHAPNQELWIAARSGGFHFHWHNETWCDTRDGVAFYDRLIGLIEAACGETVSF